MKCEICQTEGASTNKILKTEHSLCNWCWKRIEDYIITNKGHDVINIFWGAGHVTYQDWIGEHSLRDFIRKNNIKEVLEIGTGLSTEIFVNEGLKVVTLDSCKPHIELYSKLKPLQGKVDFIYYPNSDSLPDLSKRYPGKMWDFVFVDSPHWREKEVRMALKYANKFLYLHDPNLGEQKFFPNADWQPLWTRESKVFQKRVKP